MIDWLNGSASCSRELSADISSTRSRSRKTTLVGEILSLRSNLRLSRTKWNDLSRVMYQLRAKQPNSLSKLAIGPTNDMSWSAKLSSWSVKIIFMPHQEIYMDHQEADMPHQESYVNQLEADMPH